MPKHTCSCGARYSFPDSAAGKRAKCKKCGEVFTLPEAEEEGIFAIAGEESPFAAEAAAAASASKSKAEEYARAAILAQSRGVGQTVLETSDADPTPLPMHSRGYVNSITDSFFFITSLGNLLVFMVIWLLLFAAQMLPIARLPFAGMFMALGVLVVGLWYSAYRYQIVSAAAGGDRNLPEPELSIGEALEYLSDAFKWLLSWVFVMGPAIGYVALLVSKGDIVWYEGLMMLLSDWGGLFRHYEAYPGFVWLVLAGTLVWPMAVLCLVLGGLDAMVRLDLIIVTILRAPGGYLATLFFWGAALGLTIVGEWGIQRMITAGAAGISGVLVASALAVGVSVYAEFVSLRVIGLYYHHFKDRFAWDWG